MQGSDRPKVERLGKEAEDGRCEEGLIGLGCPGSQRQPESGNVVLSLGNLTQCRPTLRIPTGQELSVHPHWGQSGIDQQMPPVASQRLIPGCQGHEQRRVINEHQPRSPVERSEHGARVLLKTGTIVGQDDLPVFGNQGRGNQQRQRYHQDSGQPGQARGQRRDRIGVPRIGSPGPDQKIIPRKVAHHEGSTEREGQERNPIAQLTGAELQIKRDSDTKTEPSENQHLPGDHRGQGIQTGPRPRGPANTDSHQRRDHHQEQKQKTAPRKHQQLAGLELQARPKKAPEAFVKSSGHARRQRNPD